MANDKNIACTILDAIYIGNDKNEFTKNKGTSCNRNTQAEKGIATLLNCLHCF